MKLAMLGAMLLTMALIFSRPALAAPLPQEQPPVIAQPEQDVPVRGVVQIVGSATHPQFQRYELYYAPWPVPSDQSWIFIGDAHYQQQPLGLLGTWDSRSVPDGTYVLRVRVVKQDGNYLDSEPRRVRVINTRPPDTPTPAATDTPTPVPTPLPPTPTVIVEVPAVETPTPEPTDTPEPHVTPILPAEGGEQGSALAVEQLLSPARLLRVARMSAMYTVGVFVAVGLFFGIKALLYWLWLRLRP